MRAKCTAEGGSGGTAPGNFWDFWPSEVVSDAIYKCKNVAGLYRSAAVGTVLASWSMDIYGYSDTSHADSALPVRRSAGTAS